MSRPFTEPPETLDGAALAFWDRHAARLADAGVLTDADVESFVVLCRTWANLEALRHVTPGADTYREMIQLANLTKQYVTLATQFALLPQRRKQTKMSVEKPKQTDRFGL